MIASSPIPVTGHQRRVTIGGGLGLTGHAARRIVDSTSVLAMPETKIGLFPDCALLHQLSRAGTQGLHAALTGNPFTGGDAIKLGIADVSADVRARSPSALLVTMRALRRAEMLQLSKVFGQDLRVAERMVPVDFAEGVRALLVDKDNQPQWHWSTLEDVPAAAVDEVFAY